MRNSSFDLAGSILALDSHVFIREVPEKSSIVLVAVPVENKRGAGKSISQLLPYPSLAATHARIVEQHHAPRLARFILEVPEENSVLLVVVPVEMS